MFKRIQSKASFCIDDQNTVNVMNSISKSKLEDLKHSFLQYKEGQNANTYISQNNCFLILQQNGFLIDDQKKLEILNLLENSKKIDYNKFAKILVYILQAQNNKGDLRNNYEYIDAFVALGGESDGSGQINTSYLQKVLEQFELNVDIKTVLEQMGIREQELDYLIFCKLFDTPIFEDKQSMHSFFTQKSIFTNVQVKSEQFERNLYDFEKFMTQHPTFFDQQQC